MKFMFQRGYWGRVLSNLLLSHALVHLEQGIGAFRLEIKKLVVWNVVKVKMDLERGKNESCKDNLQKDGNWIKLGHVESFDGVRRNIQDAVLPWQRKWICHMCGTFLWFQGKRPILLYLNSWVYLELPHLLLTARLCHIWEELWSSGDTRLWKKYSKRFKTVWK